MDTKKAEANLHIEAAKQGRVRFVLLGQTPLYYNAMSAKAKRPLLIGGGKKTAAEKKEIKHNPKEEFNDSVYQMLTGETFLGFPAPPENFDNIAERWTQHMGNYVSSYEVCIMMADLKLARLAKGDHHKRIALQTL